jgi:hypothetical protein
MRNGSDSQDTLSKTRKKKDMYRLIGLLAVALLGLGSQEALAQARWNLPNVALKSGESVEVFDLYSVSSGTCRSLLKDPPVVEVMEGPSEVTASVKEDMVNPREQGCSQKVKGGRLVLAAKNIEEYSTSKLTIRITYHTKDGDTQRSQSFNITLFPKQE